MQPRIKMGLTVGAIGLALNICIAGFMGICGPFVSLFAGSAAGFFAAQQEKLSAKNDGAKAGAIAGGIAGALVLIGQVIGGIGALTFMQTSGAFSRLPPIEDVTKIIVFLVFGIGTSLCFGIFGAIVAALAGAGTGYMATPDQPHATPPM
jgi:hypothetical protein